LVLQRRPLVIAIYDSKWFMRVLDIVKRRGYGSKRKPEQKRFAKTTKKVVLKLKCSKCGYVTHRRGIRLKKAELVEVTK